MRTSSSFVIALGLLTIGAGAQAADYRAGRPYVVGPVVGAPAPLPVESRRQQVVVQVDELYLRSGGCPQARHCIPPRVLPIVGHGLARAAVYVPVAIPVDPRFAHRY